MLAVNVKSFCAQKTYNKSVQWLGVSSNKFKYSLGKDYADSKATEDNSGSKEKGQVNFI